MQPSRNSLFFCLASNRRRNNHLPPILRDVLVSRQCVYKAICVVFSINCTAIMLQAIRHNEVGGLYDCIVSPNLVKDLLGDFYHV